MIRAIVTFLILIAAHVVFAQQDPLAQTPASRAESELTSPMTETAFTTGALVLATEEEAPLPKFQVLPPLGLDDAMRTVADCINFLKTPNTKFTDYKREKVTDALNAVIDYMKIVDDRHSTLENYRWYLIGKEKVSHGGIDADPFPVVPPLGRVSAVSFVAERGDVTIHRMTVSDAKGNETKFTIERLVRADLPRKEVCFLYYQQSVAQIVLYYSTNDEKVDPRVKVYCGVTPVPEYAKEAIYFLTLAKRDLAQSHFQEAIADLREAWKRLAKLKSSWLGE